MYKVLRTMYMVNNIAVIITAQDWYGHGAKELASLHCEQGYWCYGTVLKSCIPKAKCRTEWMKFLKPGASLISCSSFCYFLLLWSEFFSFHAFTSPWDPAASFLVLSESSTPSKS